VSKGSETISERWVDGAKRECVVCGVKITNLSKQVGLVRSHYLASDYPRAFREIVCVNCRPGARK
jgi:hypothetical protein